MSTPRISVAGAMVLAAPASVLLGFLILPLGRRMEWVRIERQMRSSLESMKPTQQEPVDPGTWDCARTWVITAFSNVCFSPEHTSTAEMYQLRDDLEKKLKGGTDLGTLEWMWHRLSETGPHGKQYTEEFDPFFRDCFTPRTW